MATYRPLRPIAAGSALAVFLQSMFLLTADTQIAIQPLGIVELIPAASAQQSRGITYRPPTKLTRATRTAGTGVRGLCNQLGRIEVTPLVPDNHIGQTLSKRPTFLAYVAGGKSVEFTLVEPNVEKPLLVKTVTPNAQGLVRVDLPEAFPDLEVGKNYRWSISVVCNPNRRSGDVFAQSWIQRVEPSVALTQKLSSANSKLEQARLYAEAGVWYDAIATLTEANQVDPNDSAIRSDLTALLSQVQIQNVVLTAPTNRTVTSNPTR
jgi:hypothetical protein